MEPEYSLLLFCLMLGLTLLAISRHYRIRIEKMDAEFTGDILPNKESTDWHWYGRRINYRIMKATKYIGWLILSIPVMILCMLILDFF